MKNENTIFNRNDFDLFSIIDISNRFMIEIKIVINKKK